MMNFSTAKPRAGSGEWRVLTLRRNSGINRGDIAEMVASMTEGDPGVASERASYNAPG